MSDIDRKRRKRMDRELCSGEPEFLRLVKMGLAWQINEVSMLLENVYFCYFIK